MDVLGDRLAEGRDRRGDGVAVGEREGVLGVELTTGVRRGGKSWRKIRRFRSGSRAGEGHGRISASKSGAGLPSRGRRGEVREGRAAEIGKGCHAGIRSGRWWGERFRRGGKVTEGEQRIGQRIGGDFGGRKASGGEGRRGAQRIRRRSGLGGIRCQIQLQGTKPRTAEGIGSGIRAGLSWRRSGKRIGDDLTTGKGI